MAKALTAAGIARYKPSKQRREIRDGAATGLYLILQESGQRSFALRFRKPNGKPAKLTLGPVDVSGVEPATAPWPGKQRRWCCTWCKSDGSATYTAKGRCASRGDR
jgi:hypothetical protein